MTSSYSYADTESIIIGGDFSSRIGNLDDCIADVDDVLPRKPIDSVRDQHGGSLIEFLHE